MSKRLEKVKRGIALLKAIDPRYRVLGSETHGYELAAPLTAGQLAAIEQALGAELPEEVRELLQQVGASGAGPHYGLLPLSSAAATSDKELGRMVRIADQGCGMSSFLLLTGPRAGEIVADRSEDGSGPFVKEAANIVSWYQKWIDRSIREWAESLPLLPFERPTSPEQQEAAVVALEKMSAIKKKLADTWVALGHLHLYAGRFDEAEAAFVAAFDAPNDPRLSKTPKPQREALLWLNRARLHYTRGGHAQAIEHARAGLAIEGAYFTTHHHLLLILERALMAAGREDEALEVFDAIAAGTSFDFGAHHELAHRRLARGDVGGAIAALERSTKQANIIDGGSTFAQRVAGAFDPVVAKLRADGRGDDADTLAARAVELARSA